MARYECMQIGVDKYYIQYPSPTGILGLLSKGDAIPMWSANKTVEYIKEKCPNYTEKNNYIVDDKDLNEARFNWKNTRTQTADLGSELHRIIEKFINISNPGFMGGRNIYRCFSVSFEKYFTDTSVGPAGLSEACLGYIKCRVRGGACLFPG